ncbi:hypothetical protein, partial [Halalkalibacter flavus]|uniref:hypothetical protein n=1 Tax=Halalkalibacter flavus TaxID=3090668 RepID=UPI002FC7EAF9
SRYVHQVVKWAEKSSRNDASNHSGEASLIMHEHNDKKRFLCLISNAITIRNGPSTVNCTLYMQQASE